MKIKIPWRFMLFVIRQRKNENRVKNKYIKSIAYKEVFNSKTYKKNLVFKIVCW